MTELGFHCAYIRNSESECWIWIRARNAAGYGHAKWNGRYVGAHRIAWEVWRGPIPDGMHVLHKCDMPPCVNPEHLFLGTNDDNIKDRIRKDRSSHHASRFGESHYRAKVTESDVRTIRQLHEGGITLPRLSEVYKLHTATLYAIVAKKSWKHVA